MRADIVTARAAVAHAAWHGRTEVDHEPTSGPPPGWPCRTGAGGTRSTRRAWTRTCLTSCSASDEPEPDRRTRARRTRPDRRVRPTATRRSGRRRPSRRSPAARPTPPTRAEPARRAQRARSSPASVAPAGRRLPDPALHRRAASARGEAGPAQPGHHQQSGGRSAPRPTGRRAGPLHLPATIRAAAPQQDRPRPGIGQRLRLARDDLRLAVTEGRESNLVLLVVDASGSMAARRRMEAVKAAALSLLLDAYQRRDKVGLITFRGAGATLALPPTSSIDVAARRLARAAQRRPHPAGRGPALRRGDPAAGSGSATRAAGRCWCWSPTAGPPPARTRWPARGRPPTSCARAGIASVVIDCETGRFSLGLAAAAQRRTSAPSTCRSARSPRIRLLSGAAASARRRAA